MRKRRKKPIGRLVPRGEVYSVYVHEGDVVNIRSLEHGFLEIIIDAIDRVWVRRR